MTVGLQHRKHGWLHRTLSLALFVGLGCASNGDGPTIEEFDAARTKGEMIRFIGKLPRVCAPSRAETELCGWQLRNRDASWKPLSQAAQTRHPINLLCEFPTQGGPRAEQSCTVISRKSRDFDPEKTRRAFPGEALEAEMRTAPDEDPRAWEAHRVLSTARDLRALSLLVGDAPTRCATVSARDQLCYWHLSNQASGHETLAAIPDTRGRAWLACELPLDGSSRSANSCTVTKP